MNSYSESAKVAKHWGKYEPSEDAASYYTSPIMRPYHIELALGVGAVEGYRLNKNWSDDFFIHRYLNLGHDLAILSLCCGFGAVEQYFLKKLPNVTKCVAVDLSDRALAAASQRAKEDGLSIEYQCADLNKYQWKDSAYDLVIANGALHHIKNLEEVMQGIKKTLKPEGILYSCEYVGPDYMDHSSRQLELINACAYIVPPELRGRKGLSVRNKTLFRWVSKAHSIAARKIRPEWANWKKAVSKMLKLVLKRNQSKFEFGVVHISPKEYLLKIDPSECVKSSEILPIMRNVFKNVEVMPLGGGILQHALDECFYENFDVKNLGHVNALNRLCEIEKNLMLTDDIGIENAIIVARKS